MRWFITYVKESWQELGKVVWPDRPTSIRLTVAVLVFAALFAAYMAGADVIISELVERVLL